MRIIQYIRVSTTQQGKSGLGLEAQQEALAQFAQQHQAEVVATYPEVESGKRNDRPELAKAIAHARRIKGTLVVAKLDRLARNVAFLATLMESKIDFVACDNPNATKFTLHILSAVAEHEAQMISDRTRAALAAAKKRGVKLGSSRPGHWKGREDRRREGARKAGQFGAMVNRQAAVDAYAELQPLVQEMRAKGQSFRQIAAQLNQEGHTTRNGREWNQVQVMRVLNRISA